MKGPCIQHCPAYLTYQARVPTTAGWNHGGPSNLGVDLNTRQIVVMCYFSLFCSIKLLAQESVAHISRYCTDKDFSTLYFIKVGIKHSH